MGLELGCSGNNKLIGCKEVDLACIIGTNISVGERDSNGTKRTRISRVVLDGDSGFGLRYLVLSLAGRVVLARCALLFSHNADDGWLR